MGGNQYVNQLLFTLVAPKHNLDGVKMLLLWDDLDRGVSGSDPIIKELNIAVLSS